MDNALLGFDKNDPASRAARAKPVEGLQALVSGHSVVEDVTVTANQWNLDTGAGVADRNCLRLLEINPRELQPLTLDVRETPWTSSCVELARVSA